MSAADAETFHLEEASLADVSKALDTGIVSSVELTVLYLNRVAAYDRHGPLLNAIPILNPDVLVEASVADEVRRAGGKSALLGVPFTVKDSYKVKGLTVAAGSPAFASMIADEDAFTIGRIRAAGGVLIGKTNMPPLAAGGMQKGVYGRAESPYNGEYLTAGFNSGSSNGSATATTANFAMFGMGKETVSSGRSPASNNAVIAYTPSRGMLSIRGNWPLFPVRDVVVPHTRSVQDMLALLNVIEVTDPITVGDFWRDQKAVKLPSVESVRPADFSTLARTGSLRGKRIGVPTMYIGKDDTGSQPIKVRPSVMALWRKAADDLRKLGAEVVEVDFDLMHEMEVDRPGAQGPVKLGYFSDDWLFGPWNQPETKNKERLILIPYLAEQF
ncbi:MAG TPA: amidase family protein, partial [Steroidobacteraceae bacterium]